MAEQKYEFQSVRAIDRAPLVVSKLVCSLLLVWCSYLSIVAVDMADRMQQLSFVLSLTFFYANLAKIKYELREFFEPPYELIGYPMAVLAFILSISAIYI